MPDAIIKILFDLAKVVGVFMGVLTTATILIWVERRVSAWMQDRSGPNRVGPFGLIQPIADVVKLIMKEDIIPAKAERFTFVLACFLIAVPSMVSFAVVPFGDEMRLAGQTVPLVIADLNVGILFVLAVSSLTVYGIVLAGWSSRSTYPLLGGLRSSAQMISYEIPLGLSLIPVLMLTGSLRLTSIVQHQTETLFLGLPAWNIFLQPLAFLIFIISVAAESNRLPFDLPQTEQELVGGYHTEYSAMKFAIFGLSEFFNMITASMLIVTLFFGGWHVPGLRSLGLDANLRALLEIVAFMVKTGICIMVFVWVRWSFPRFRFDQLMGLGWKVLLPLSLVNIAVTGIWMAWGK